MGAAEELELDAMRLGSIQLAPAAVAFALIAKAGSPNPTYCTEAVLPAGYRKICDGGWLINNSRRDFSLEPKLQCLASGTRTAPQSANQKLDEPPISVHVGI
jgi:hypothetical protein